MQSHHPLKSRYLSGFFLSCMLHAVSGKRKIRACLWLCPEGWSVPVHFPCAHFVRHAVRRFANHIATHYHERSPAYKKGIQMRSHQPAPQTETDSSSNRVTQNRAMNAPVADQRAAADVQRQRNQLVDNSPAASVQRQRNRMIDNSPATTAQRALAGQIDSSVQTVQQRAAMGVAQRAGAEEELPAQGKFSPVQRSAEPAEVNGLPTQLKQGIESLSGVSMAGVRVHYNSPKPAQLQAHAYAQGNDIHVAPGQEQHVPHEAWHVVQQRQGRVKPTMQMKTGVPVNDDAGLEAEADAMGSKAMAVSTGTAAQAVFKPVTTATPSLQLRRYSVERTIKLDLGEKVLEQQEEKKHPKDSKKDVPWQHAKTRARGLALSYLRESYPTSPECRDDASPEAKDLTRGPVFAEAKLALNEKYKILDTDPKDQTATVTRTAIFKNAEEGSRAGSTQANGVKALTGNDNYIGAHLVKREWGGADNMWNVVAWQKSAEDIWAAGFERAVDMKGVFGEDPGTISISVEKEDEFLTPQKQTELINNRPVTTKTGLEGIAEARYSINRAIESVPLRASGTNFERTTNLDGATIGYNMAIGTAVEKFSNKIDQAISVSTERDTFSGKRPLPNDMQDAEGRLDSKQLDERKKAWKLEKDTYGRAGKDAFEFKNTVFEE